MAVLRKRFWIGGGALALVGAAAIALGPGAAPIVDAVADGQKVWRLGRLQVDGVSGAWIGDLRARTVTLSDEDGVWARATDARLSWSPHALLLGRVVLNDAALARINIARKPILTAPRPPGNIKLDVRLRAARIDALHVAESAFGRDAEARLWLSLSTDDNDLKTFALDAEGLNGNTDRAHLRFDAANPETLSARIDGAADGLIAALIGAPDGDGVTLNADATNSAAHITGAIGAAHVLDGAMTWDDAHWRAQVTANVARVGLLAPVTARLGEAWTFEAQGARGQARNAFNAQFTAPNLAAQLNGETNRAGGLREPMRLTAQTNNLHALARGPSGAASLEGALSLADDRFTFAGEAQARAIPVADDHLVANGPLRVTFGPTTIAVESALRVAGQNRSSRAAAMLQGGVLDVELSYDRQRAALSVRQARLREAPLTFNADGRTGSGGGAFGGAWRLASLNTVSSLSGAASGRFAITSTQHSPWLLTLDARGASVRGDDILAQALGAAPQLSLEAQLGPQIQVRRAILNGAKVRAGAQGILRDGQADLAFEASARGPITIGALEWSGVADATGRITGPFSQPRLNVRARWPEVNAAGVRLTNPVLDFTYDAGARTGDVHLTADAFGAPAQARAQIALHDDVVTLSDINAQSARLNARGDLAITPHGPRGALTLNGDIAAFNETMSGAFAAQATLTSAAGQETQLSLDANLQRAQIGAVRLSRVDASASGPLNAVNFNARAQGAAGESALQLSLNGAWRREEDANILTVESQGAIGAVRIATRSPAQARFTRDGFSAQAALISGAGEADIAWRDERDHFEITAQLRNAALQPLAELAGVRALGDASGDVALRSAGDTLRGEAHLATRGFRLPMRMREAIDFAFDGTLANSRLDATMTARSADGLDARLEAHAPVLATARPARIGISPIGEGNASWRINGPAGALWSLIGGLDQSLEGDATGQGAVRFSATRMSGNGELRLTNGRFEEKRAGLRLQNVSALMRFDDEGQSRFELSAQDPQGGSLTGSGTARGVRDGRILLTLTHMRLLNREDARIIASGPMTFEWSSRGPLLSGALAVESADLRLPNGAAANIPHLDVIEINGPLQNSSPSAEAQTQGAAAPRLNLALTAPARIYTRGRGLNAEWSLDARVRGTTNAPYLTGEARLIRGDFDLAGRRFDLARGRIVFDGDPFDATLDLLAERESDDLTASIAITGSVSDPELALSSTPALPEDEILPQLLFGRNAEDLSALEAAQLASSVAALTGQAAFDLASLARDAVGLDRLQVAEDSNGVVVTGGRYLTRDVYVEIARNSLGEASTRVEWRVRPKLSLITSFLANGDQRASIRWRRDY